MEKFRVILQSQPEKYYHKVDVKTAKALEECFINLEKNPFYFPGRIKKLKGRESLFRYATHHLRVVYEIEQRSKTVGVVAILPRGDVYKKI